MEAVLRVCDYVRSWGQRLKRDRKLLKSLGRENRQSEANSCMWGRERREPKAVITFWIKDVVVVVSNTDAATGIQNFGER